MVVSHYIGNDEFFKRILIAILFKNFYDPENIKPSTGRKQERVRVVPVPELVPVKQKILHLRFLRAFNRPAKIDPQDFEKHLTTYDLRARTFLTRSYACVSEQILRAHFTNFQKKSLKRKSESEFLQVHTKTKRRKSPFNLLNYCVEQYIGFMIITLLITSILVDLDVGDKNVTRSETSSRVSDRIIHRSTRRIMSLIM